MAFNNNASRLYVVEETTAGTLKVPSAGSEALALQPGFEMTPNTDTQVNEELRASIGPSKPILGIERPTSSFNHYLRGSGTQGTTNDLHLLFKSIFGSTSTNGTERVTTTGSSTTVVEAAAGGSDWALGKAVLVKMAVYEIRPVDSVATNALTLGFALNNAPGSGISLGKCINYTPVNSGHPTLSLWLYRANQADVEAIAGGLVNSMEISVSVGELINIAFQVGGTKFFFNPITITATTKYIDVEDDGGDANAVLTEKTYRNPLELAQAAEDAINAVASETWTVVFNSHGAKKGKFTFSATGTTVKIEWNTGTNTANSAAAKFGFSTAADSTGATSYDSTTVQSYADGQTPSLDSADPMVAKDMEVLLGDRSDYVRPCIQTMSINVGLDKSDVRCLTAESGIGSQVVRRRNSSIEMTFELEQHEADLFDRFINNRATKFCFNWGIKSGGNWLPGLCGNVYCPQGTISAIRVGEADGQVIFTATYSPYVDTSGNPEIYANQL